MHRQNTPETPDIIALSIILLAKVLEGTSCVEVSRDYGIHPNTVARRIKVLVRHLQQVTRFRACPTWILFRFAIYVFTARSS